MPSDTPHVDRIVRRAPLALLRTFLAQIRPECAHAVDWDASEKVVRRQLKTVVQDLPVEQRRAWDEISERIVRMTDEAGVEAIGYIRDEIIAADAFERQTDQYARSLWLYLNEHDHFLRAEDARYADEFRGSARIYSAFKGPIVPSLEIREDHRNQWLGSMTALFRHPSPVLLDHFVRPRHDIEGGDEIELHQFSIHHNDNQQSVETIADDGDRALIYFCPLNSIKITYEPANGVIEIYSRERGQHGDIARLFARHILGCDDVPEAIPKRCYDLRSLAQPRPFPVEDADIASVRVAQLRFKLSSRRSSLTLKLGARESGTIWELADTVFGNNSLFSRAYDVNQASLVIGFHKQPGQRRAKTLAILLSLPNGCNVKSHCDKDRQLADKYLKLWNLLQTDEPPDTEPAGAQGLVSTV